MVELVNLRMARKRAKRRQQETLAGAERLAHGQPKRQRALSATLQAKAKHDLDRHQIETGDDR